MKTLGTLVVVGAALVGLLWLGGYVKGNADIHATQKGQHEIQKVRNKVADEIRGH